MSYKNFYYRKKINFMTDIISTHTRTPMQRNGQSKNEEMGIYNIHIRLLTHNPSPSLALSISLSLSHSLALSRALFCWRKILTGRWDHKKNFTRIKEWKKEKSRYQIAWIGLACWTLIWWSYTNPNDKASKHCQRFDGKQTHMCLLLNI